MVEQPSPGARDTALVGLGANLPSPAHGPPRATLEAALAALAAAGLRVLARSRWYRTAPVPVSDQPWYVNGVARLAVGPEPAETLRVLHRIERDFGRVRGERDAARLLDLDLLDQGGVVRGPGPDGGPVLPHPRLHRRAFVLLPLAEVAPGWRHPRLGLGADALLAALPPGQRVEILDDVT